LFYAVLKVSGRGMRGERMNIGDEKIAVVIFLHFDETAHGTEIISEMQISGWPDSADNYLFGHDFRSKMGSKNTSSICISQELIEKGSANYPIAPLLILLHYSVFDGIAD